MDGKSARRPSIVSTSIPPNTKLLGSAPQVKRIIRSPSENDYFTSRGKLSNKRYKVDNGKCQKFANCHRQKLPKINRTESLQGGRIFNNTVHMADWSKLMLRQIQQYSDSNQLQNIQPVINGATAYSQAESSALGDCWKACAAKHDWRIHCPITTDPKVGQQCIFDAPKYSLDLRKVNKYRAATKRQACIILQQQREHLQTTIISSIPTTSVMPKAKDKRDRPTPDDDDSDPRQKPPPKAITASAQCSEFPCPMCELVLAHLTSF